MPSFYKYKTKTGEKWGFIIDTGKNQKTGVRKQKRRQGFKTKGEASSIASTITVERNAGTYIDESDLLFKDFAKEWLEGYSETVKGSTAKTRKAEINRLNEFFGYEKIKDINKRIYKNALAKLNKKYKKDTARITHSVAKMIFGEAKEIDLIKVDPTETTKRFKNAMAAEEPELPKYMEKDELKHFLKIIEEHGTCEKHTSFLVLAYTGIRAGELAALKWTDIDFEENEINIDETLYNPTNKFDRYILQPPKTKKSIRKISVSTVVMNQLKKHKNNQLEMILKCGNAWYNANFVFTAKMHLGYPKTVPSVGLDMEKFIKLSGLPENLTPHSLRHTHTSLLAEAGASLEEIMDRLGHANDVVTRLVYLHVTKTMKKEAAQKFDKLMGNF